MVAEIMHERESTPLVMNERLALLPDGLRAMHALPANAVAIRHADRSTPPREEILGKVAHELRTPLSTILMTTGFVLEELLPAAPNTALRLHIETIKRPARLMARLVDDLLEDTTISSGRLALVRASVCAGDLFAAASTLLQPIAAARQITLRFVEGEALPSFTADEGRLLQVIANLVGNAIKFTAPGGMITVSARSGPHCMSFRVADSGSGIAAADLTHVFDRHQARDISAWDSASPSREKSLRHTTDASR